MLLYLNILLLVRANGINLCIMAFKGIKLLPTQIPHLKNSYKLIREQRDKEMLVFYTSNVLTYLNQFVISTSHNTHLLVWVGERQVIYTAYMSINLNAQETKDWLKFSPGTNKYSKRRLNIPPSVGVVRSLGRHIHGSNV